MYLSTDRRRVREREGEPLSLYQLRGRGPKQGNYKKRVGLFHYYLLSTDEISL
jgi:hypothetical protein